MSSGRVVGEEMHAGRDRIGLEDELMPIARAQGGAVVGQSERTRMTAGQGNEQLDDRRLARQLIRDHPYFARSAGVFSLDAPGQTPTRLWLDAPGQAPTRQGAAKCMSDNMAPTLMTAPGSAMSTAGLAETSRSRHAITANQTTQSGTSSTAHAATDIVNGAVDSMACRTVPPSIFAQGAKPMQAMLAQAT